MHAQEFRDLGFDLAAQFRVLVQQGTDLFAALAQLFGAESAYASSVISSVPSFTN